MTVIDLRQDDQGSRLIVYLLNERSCTYYCSLFILDLDGCRSYRGMKTTLLTFEYYIVRAKVIVTYGFEFDCDFGHTVCLADGRSRSRSSSSEDRHREKR